jgi:hypothetical protein
MSSTSSETGFLSSPRNQRWLMWISGAVLVVGVAVFLGVFLSRGSSSPSNANVSTVGSAGPSSTKPAASKSTKVAPSASALQVARKFLETAVLRKNLDASYAIVGPTLKEQMSRAQWRKGNIAVDPYPANNAKTAKLNVAYSHKNHLMLIVALTPQKGSGVPPQAYKLGVDRINGKWLVNYWIADYSHKVKENPYSN